MMLKVPYASIVDSLQFAVNVPRFDIAFGVNVLSQYLQNSSMEHWNATKRVFRYLKVGGVRLDTVHWTRCN